MAYTEVDYKSKKAVKEALAAGVEVLVYQPGPFGPDVRDGSVALEGPHYPKPHSWYGSGVVKDGVLISIK
jgi:hypothetical protein